MMSPALAPVIGAGAGFGICTFCTENEWYVLNSELQSNLLSRNHHHSNCHQHPCPLHCVQYQLHSVQSDTWLQLSRQLGPADSCAILKAAVRTSHSPLPRQQLCSLSLQDTITFLADRHSVDWGGPSEPHVPVSWPSEPPLFTSLWQGWVVCSVWCPPHSESAFLRCGASAADCGPEYSESRSWGQCSVSTLVTLSSLCPPCVKSSWSGALSDTSDSVGYENGTELSQAVPGVIIGPRFPFGRIRTDWEPQDSSWRNRLTAARALRDRYHDL